MGPVEFNETFRVRTKKWTLGIIKWYANIQPKTDEVRILGKQLIRSSSSVAANFRARCRVRSKAERYAKFCIVVEESDESLFWMEVFFESELVDTTHLRTLYPEALEILKVMAKCKKGLKP